MHALSGSILWPQFSVAARTGLPISSGLGVARPFGSGADYLCAQILAAASSVVSGVDMGYAGSAGLEPQQFVSNNQPCGYICYGFGEFDGQGSGHDFSGNVRLPFVLCNAVFVDLRVHALLVFVAGELG